MGSFERYALALSLTGLGNFVFFGGTTPEVPGGSLWIMGALAAVCLLAFPAHCHSLSRVKSRVGATPMVLSLFILLALPFDIRFLQTLDRWDPLGLAIALSALFAIISCAWRLSGRGWWLAHTSALLQIAGFAIIGGALLSGYLQIATALFVLAALLFGFRWFVFGICPVPPLAILFAFAVPLAMISTLQIGHLLAAPLIASFVVGFGLSLPTAEAGSRQPPE